jgi:predicted GIY-YIG superfamily endonuclease/predicted transcriptional regulator
MIYVYGLYKKKIEYSSNRIDEGLFYIGVTKDIKVRANSHKSKKNNPIKKAYINKYDFEIKILFRYKTYQEALEMESFLIRWFGRIVNGTGILTNILIEQEDIKSLNKGKTFSSQHRRKMSESCLQRSEEYFNAQRDSKLSLPIDEIHKLLQEWENSFPVDKSICEKYGIKKNTFNWWIRKYRPDLRNLVKQNQIKHCQIMTELNYSQTKYANEIGVSPSTVSSWYCKYVRDKKEIKSIVRVENLEYKKQKYAEWMNSGLSKREFCKKNNINYSSFKAWKNYYENY